MGTGYLQGQFPTIVQDGKLVFLEQRAPEKVVFTE